MKVDRKFIKLSRDVERTALSCTVWPLEGVKFDYLLSVLFTKKTSVLLIVFEILVMKNK